MRQYKIHIVSYIACLCLFLSPACSNDVWSKDFVIVIDPGHGGRDPGALGKISKEKDINLSVALKLGNLIQANCDDVKVIYTRNKDVLIPLDKRADIANKAKADLFISIHTNSISGSKTIKGPSTWTLGLAKSDVNLEVAKRENSVILFENDYQTRYEGFNPNSAESYIIFEFMQDKYMEQSVHLASLVQKQFRTTCKRVDQGVHQAGFLVLKESAMPSILVELGFISTPEEERYLNTEAGKSTLANGIFRAFMTYKREHELRLTGASRTIIPTEELQVVAETESIDDPDNSQEASSPDRKQEKTDRVRPSTSTPSVDKNKSTNNGSITFMVQILTSDVLLDKNSKQFKGLKDVGNYKEGKVFKYTYGASTDYNQTLRTKRQVEKNFKGAFVIAFKNGEKMNINAAIAEFTKNNNKK